MIFDTARAEADALASKILGEVRRHAGCVQANRTKVIRVTVYLASSENDLLMKESGRWLRKVYRAIAHTLRASSCIPSWALGRASDEISEEVRSLFARNGVASLVNGSGKTLGE